MPDSIVFDKTVTLLKQSMDVASRRHGLITSNIANADNVGYQPKELDFQKALKAAMQPESEGLSVTQPGHIRRARHGGATEAALVRDVSHSVDIDKEMTNLVENNIRYRTSAELLLRKLTILRQAITEGGR